MRSEFEKIEWVKERLNHVWWSQENGYCDTGKHPRANASFLNGAWYAYQHQQSKVDELQVLYTQQGVNMLKLQKRENACQKLLEKWKTTGLNGTSDYAVGGAHARQNCEDELEQALKGGTDASN